MPSRPTRLGMAPPTVHAMRPVSSPMVTLWLGMPRPAMAASKSSTDRVRSGLVMSDASVVASCATQCCAYSRPRASFQTIGPQMVQRTASVFEGAPFATSVSWKISNAFGPAGVRYLFASRGSGSIRTRSLQSPPVLVNPHATWPLLPTTMLGRPGSDTPVIFCGAPSASGNAIDARYQMIGTPIDKCMSLATRATPDAVCAPSTAQLLLPIMVSSSPSVTDGCGARRARVFLRSNTSGPGMAGRTLPSPITGVSHSDP